MPKSHLSLRAFVPFVAAVAALGLLAGPAVACGGLVGENGTIQLTRTTTLAAYHDGVERYVTSFDFSGQGKEVGSIVPLPAVPQKVTRGGDWTLQRLEREVAPLVYPVRYTVGSQLPAGVMLAPLPAATALRVPSIRAYSYARVGGRILLVAPVTYTVVADITP